jgi:hypothetical protein
MLNKMHASLDTEAFQNYDSTRIIKIIKIKSKIIKYFAETLCDTIIK